MSARVVRLTAVPIEDDRDATAFLDEVIASFPAFVIRLGADDEIRYVNRVVPGLSLDRVIGADAYDFIEPGFHDVARTAFREARATGRTTRYPAMGPGPDGTKSHYECVVVPIAEAEVDGGAGLCLFILDVTEHVRARESRDASAATLEVALEAAGMGRWEEDLLTGEIRWDARMLAIHGRSEPVTEAREYIETLVHPDDRAATLASSANYPKGFVDPHEYRIIRGDGDVRWLRSMAKQVIVDGVPVRMVGGMIDVTDHREAVARLEQSEKVAAIGTLAAGVAHHFNNLLTVMLSIQEELAAVVPPSHRRDLENARAAGERAADLVSQLLTYGGRGLRPEPVSLRLDRVVNQAVELTDHALDRRIRVVTQVEKPIFAVGNPDALQQVVVNLLFNARDAVQGRSDPRIHIGLRRLDAGQAELTVTDNGEGMSDEVARHVFEPFFTTKGPEGTGLGLATAASIARDHGGALSVRSAPGNGATFTLVLPTTDGD